MSNNSGHPNGRQAYRCAPMVAVRGIEHSSILGRESKTDSLSAHCFLSDVPLVDWEELLRAVKQYKRLVIEDCGYKFDKAIAERELLDAIEQVEGLEPEGAGR